MPIDVTCTGCRTRFQVSEKFAGKKGPCPKCKVVITVPTLKEQVVIEAPDTAGPKDSTGRPVFTPIKRTEAKISQPVAIGIGGAIFAVLLIALILRMSPKPISPVITALGALILAPALAFAGYTFLRDDEYEPYRGTALWIRLAACSAVYAVLWGLYWGVFAYLNIHPEFMQLLFVLPVVIAIGTVAAVATFDLEFTQAALHYLMYLAVTIFLRLLAGINPFWDQ